MNDAESKSVEEYRGSYLSIHWWPKEFYKENKDVVARINKRLGYRLELREISWPSEVKVGEKFTIETKWANVGVAPCYQGGFPCFTLKNEKGKIVWVSADESFNVRDLPTAEPGKAPVIAHKSNCYCGLIAPIPEINDGVFVFMRNNGKPELGGNVPIL